MHIAVIGSGNVGKSLAAGFHRAGHSVTLTAADPERALAAAKELGVDAGRSNAEAASSADMVVLAVPAAVRHIVADEIREAAAGKTVVDATNVLNSHMTGISAERSGAEELQDWLPGSSVVKAFNTVFASMQAEPVAQGMPLDGLYAGDDETAKQQVHDLLVAMGYRPIDVGPLSLARALEDMALVNIRLNAVNKGSWRTAWKLVGPFG